MFVHYIISLLGRGLPRRLIQYVKERSLLVWAGSLPLSSRSPNVLQVLYLENFYHWIVLFHTLFIIKGVTVNQVNNMAEFVVDLSANFASLDNPSFSPLSQGMRSNREHLGGLASIDICHALGRSS